MLGGIQQDIRYASRTLRAHPAFTTIAVLSLALGIGANTAIFSFINTVVLEPLPVKNPQQLVLVGEGRRLGHSSGPPQDPMDIFSWRQYQDFRKAGVFSDVLAAQSYGMFVYPVVRNQPETGAVNANLVSGNYFDVLGVQPSAGRLFDPAMDKAPAPYAVLNDAYWQREFHRDPAIIGSTARIGARDYTIIGVAQRGFFGIRPGVSYDIWIPLTMQPYLPGQADWLKLPMDDFLNVVGRLRPGTSPAQAEARINLIYGQNLPSYLAALSPDLRAAIRRVPHIAVTSAARGISTLRRNFEQPLGILMWVVALVLAIAAANVANLVMAQNARRQKEFALRTAIGASRGQLIRLVLSESLLIACAGGALGILIASAGSRVLVHLISTGASSLPIGFDPDARVLGFTVAVSVLTGVLFGIAPALRGTKTDLNIALKESRASMASPKKLTFGRAMVISQVALSMTLLVGSGLLLRSFRNLITKSLGFDREHVLVAQLDTVAAGYNGDESLANLYRRAEKRIENIPGVRAAAFSHRVFNEGRWTEGFNIPGVYAPRVGSALVLNFVGDEFFRALGIPLLEGREFNDHDTYGGDRVAIINETMVKKIFGTLDPIGRVIMMSPITDKDVPYRIVGVVKDSFEGNVKDATQPTAFVPLSQNPVFAGDVVVRAAGDPRGVASDVRAALHATDPNLPIHWITTLDEQVSDSLVMQRAVAQLTTFFAALAVLLAAIGLYGTISFAVARRTGEIGIRMALGAERGAVVSMVLGDAVKLLGAGIAIGLPLAFAATALVRSVLYGVGRFDGLTISGAILALAAAALIAAWLPARRASRVDPMTALRYE